MPFDAFISYSHAADGELAPALQNGLQRLAKPWTRRQALRIFRDDTGLSVSPGLWPSITAALDESQYFILLASPGAAQSEWVNREIEYWLASRPDAAERILPVLTEGTFVWHEDANDIDWAASTAAPAALAGVFASEPRHLDLVWARTQDDLDLHNARFRDAVADLAAPIHGIPKDELESEDVRQHRKALVLRRSAVAGLVVLLIGVTIASVLALRSADTARAALQDLEDANGNISDLEAEEARLNAANEAAESSLAATEASLTEAETAQADAETAQAAAEQQAAQADSARAESERLKAEAEQEAAEADEAREVAVEAQQTAEAARVEAEAAQQAAEQARINAQVAQFAAEMERDNAESDAAEAQRLAAEAERQADEAERQADAARRAADAANDARDEARRAERTARAEEIQAKAAANAAEQAAATAREAAAAAEEAKRTAEELQAQAEEAARRAEELQRIARQAEQAASLARASLEASDPALSALLAVESFCATDGCGTSAATVERFTESASGVNASAPDLAPLLRMLEVTGEQQDFAGGLHGWSGRAVDAAIDADGNVIAALASNGRLRLWHPGAPQGQDFDLANVRAEIGSERCIACQQVTGVGVSPDGTTLAYTTRPSRPADSATFGDEWLYFVDVVTGAPTHRAQFGCRRHVFQASRVDIDLHPLRDGVALLETGPAINSGHSVIVHDPAIGGSDFNPFRDPCPPFPDAIPIPASETAVWSSDGLLVTFATESASVVDLAHSTAGAREPDLDRTDFTTDLRSTPTAAAVVDDRFAVATEDGTVAVFDRWPGQPSDWKATMQNPGDGTGLTHIAAANDLETVLGADRNGDIVRIDLGSPGGDISVRVRSSSATSAVKPAAASGIAVVVVDGRVERRSIETSWVGAAVTPGATGAISVNGAVVGDSTSRAVERHEGDSTIRMPLEAHSRSVMSADGSTVVFFPRDNDRPQLRRGDRLQTLVTLDIGASEIRVPIAAISADGATVAIPSGQDRVVLFDSANGQRTGEIKVPKMCGREQFVEQLAISNDTVIVHAGTWPCNSDVVTTVFVFDRSGRQIGEPIDIFDENFPHINVPKTVTDGPDRTFLFTEPRLDSVVRAMDLSTGALTDVFDVGANDTISAMAVEAKQGDIAALGFESGRVVLWNLETGTPAVELSRHDARVAAVAIAVIDGELRVASFGNGTAVTRVLNDPSNLRTAMCSLAGRDLDATEWATYVGDGEPLACRRGL